MSRVGRKRLEKIFKDMERHEKISERIDSWICYIMLGCVIGLVTFWFL